MISFENSDLIKKQQRYAESIAREHIRPLARYYDDPEHEHEIPWDFVRFIWDTGRKGLDALMPGAEVPDEPFATTLPRGCTVDDVLGTDESGGGDVELAPGAGTGNRCLDLASGSGVLPTTSTISFMPAAEIVRRFALTGDEARTVTVDNSLTKPLFHGRTAWDGLSGRPTIVGKLPQQVGKRIVIGRALVKDQLAGDFAQIFIDSI